MENKIIFATDYWDCECELDYVHNKEEFYCNRCSAYAEDCSDSRVDEVKKFLEMEYNDLVHQIEVVDCFGRYEIARLLKISEEVKKLNGLTS